MRVLAALGLLVVGAATALAAVALHTLGWGLALVVVTVVAVLAWLPSGWWARLPFALGWSALIGVVLVPRPEGDFAIAGDLPGYALLGLSLLVVAFCAVTLPRLRRAPRQERVPTPDSVTTSDRQP